MFLDSCVPDNYRRHIYVKCFAFFPIKCKDGKFIWLKKYYKKIDIIRPHQPYHLYNLTEIDALVDKLIE
jgi:hypothetical protein